jgi:hypothetical protein
MLTWNGCKQKAPPFGGTFYKAFTSFKYVGSSDGGRLWFSGTGLFSIGFGLKTGFKRIGRTVLVFRIRFGFFGFFGYWIT